LRDRKAEIEKQRREAIQHDYKLLVHLTANITTFSGTCISSCSPVGYSKLLCQVMLWVD